MSEGKPREFWVLERCFNPVSKWDIFNSKESLNNLLDYERKTFPKSDIKENEFHVIDFKYYTQLETQLAEAKAELAEFYKHRTLNTLDKIKTVKRGPTYDELQTRHAELKEASKGLVEIAQALIADLMRIYGTKEQLRKQPVVGELYVELIDQLVAFREKVGNEK